MEAERQKYRVIPADPGGKLYSALKTLLPEDRCRLEIPQDSGAALRRVLAEGPQDIVVINAPLPDESGVELALELAEKASGVLLLVKSDRYEAVCRRVEDSGVLTLPKPVTERSLYGAVRLLMATAARLNKLERKNQTLQSKMSDIRTVDRAKWLLIQRHHMTERDAHYYIEKQAMDTRLSRREIAESIIRTYE